MRRILFSATVVAATVILAGTAMARDNRSLQASRLRHATNVVTFFDNHSWLLAQRHETCSTVPWQRSCVIARQKYRFYTERIPVLQHRLDMSDPLIVKLNRGLSGTPMAGLGRTLRDVGRQYNVSPFFMAAAAGTESSFGAAGCGNNPRNVWGLAACDGRWHVPYFESWDEAITFYARFIHQTWPSATSPYHFSGYAACTTCWGARTSYWMQSRFGVSAFTQYPG